MKAHLALIIFAAGLGAGWLIFGGGARESSEVAGKKSAAPVVREREARPVTIQDDAKFRSFAKELPNLSDGEQKAFKKSLAPGDRAAVLNALLAQAGRDGIPWQSKPMISEILKTWAGEDFNGAWAWYRRIESDASRKFVASHLLDELVSQDADRAFALHLEIAAENPDFISSVPEHFLHKAASKDAVAYLDFLGKLPSSKSCFGNKVDFAKDFDFQQAAEGVQALKKKHGGELPVFATNFLYSWAEQDADAAYAWFAKTEPDKTSDPFSEGSGLGSFSDLLEGIEKQGGPGASHVWLAEKLNESGTARDEIGRLLSSFHDPVIINGIAKAMPDVASRDRFLDDVVTKSGASNAAVEFSYVLAQMSSPAVRLDSLHRWGNRLNPANISDCQLQQWGLTRQQVEQPQAADR
jgi:hypothetical protein